MIQEQRNFSIKHPTRPQQEDAYSEVSADRPGKISSNALSPGSDVQSKRSLWNQGRRYLLPGLLLLAMPFCIGWISQPGWVEGQTPEVANQHIALTFQYPSDWSRPRVIGVSPRLAVVDVTPSPPHGWRLWWDEHILHKNFQRWKTARISVGIFLRPEGNSIEKCTTNLQRSLDVYCARMRKESEMHLGTHPLGPELQVSVVSPGGTDFPSLISRDYFVFTNVTDARVTGKTTSHTEPEQADNRDVVKNSGTDRVQISVFSNGDATYLTQLKPEIERLVRSVHIKRTKINGGGDIRWPN